MSAEDNIKTIQGMYEAFTRGDGETILAGVTDDVDWGVESAGTTAPWHGIRHGKEEVAAFFVDFGSAIDLDVFAPTSFAATDDEVFSLVHIAGRARGTERALEMDIHHHFRFRDGKVARWRGSEDTEQIAAALEG